MKIVILERDSVGKDADVSCFEELGEVVCYPITLTEEEVAERAKDADIIVANKAPMNEQCLKYCKKVRMICEFATGYDNCDLEYCNRRGIKVANVAGYSTAMVAQHTFTLALPLLQKLRYYDNYVKSGAYGAQDKFSHFDAAFHELDGMTWGIVGMGNIGKRVAKIAAAFGCRVIFYSITGKSTCTEYERVDKETLLRESDVLSLHCPLSELSRNLIDLEALRKMKKSAVLINVARGPVVNNADLYTALTEGSIMAAGLDVLEKEPIRPDNPLSGIQDSDKLLITPHVGWGSVEARNRCVQEAFKNAKAFLNGEERNIVNG